MAVTTMPQTKSKSGFRRSLLEPFLDFVRRDRLALIGILIIVSFILIAVFAPFLAPHDPRDMLRREDGTLARLDPPSLRHPFGTTNLGRDVFSQVLIGTRAALLVGFLAAFFVTLIGTNIGIIAGYYGGWVDSLLMRLVDILYAIPLIPFVIIMMALVEPSIWNVIWGISLLTWRTVARIIRSQVLSVSQRPYVKAARMAGCSNFRIMYYHIAPNILPLALLEMAFAVGWAITAEASVSFVGFGDPTVISWGQILHMVFLTGAIRTAWWWVVPPGLAIALLLIGVFFTARSLEEVVNPRLRRR